MDEVTDGTFSVEVLASAEPVIVDFWAPWCKPCDAIEPHLVAIAEERGVRLVKLNIDENLAIPGRYERPLAPDRDPLRRRRAARDRPRRAAAQAVRGGVRLTPLTTGCS